MEAHLGLVAQLHPVANNVLPTVGHALHEKVFPIHLRRVEGQQLPLLDQSSLGVAHLVAAEHGDLRDDALVRMPQLLLQRFAALTRWNGVAAGHGPNAQRLGVVAALSVLNAPSNTEEKSNGGLGRLRRSLRILRSWVVAIDWCRGLVA